jgi:predicted Zn finger-like uncharacterized protein
VLTRCPSCATHFRVTPEQLKARTGRVRCGECQNVFNALDSLIEEPVVVAVPMAAVAVPPAPTPDEVTGAAAVPIADNAEEAAGYPINQPDEIAGPAPEAPEPQVAAGVEPVALEPEIAELDSIAETAGEDWSTTFPEPPPPPLRWPWVIGSLVALAAIVLQALLAFRVELVVLWPEGKPALVALCEIAGCEVGLPAKVGLVGIEASDLHPDSEHKGRLILAATLKNRAPFAQQFPHLELTLTDTADQAIARKVLAPADYLPSSAPITDGMKPNADIPVAIGIDSGEIAASGYRLYLFYP